MARSDGLRSASTATMLVMCLLWVAPSAASADEPFERIDRVDLDGSSDEKQLFAGVITPDGTRGLFASTVVNAPIVEVDLVTMQRVRNFSPSASLGFQSAVIDPDGDFAYFGTAGLSVRRMIGIDLGADTLLEGAQTSDTTVLLGGAVIDPDGRYAYFAENGSPHRIFRYRLFDDGTADLPPWNDGTLTSPEGGTFFVSAVVDPGGRYAYFGTGSTGTGPGRIVRIEVRDTDGDPVLRADGHLDLGATEQRLVAAVVHPSGDHAYFAAAPATGTGSGSLVKVDLRTFSRVGAVTTPVGTGLLTSAVIDPGGEFAYLSTSESPARILKVQLAGAACDGGGTGCAGMRVVDELTFASGENDVRSAVIDPAGRFAYFGTNTSPGRVVRVRIADDPEPSVATAPAPTAVSCAPRAPAAGARVTCTITGGDPGIDILWRAAYNPVFAEAGVSLDTAGSGEFSFVVPTAALGEELTVELVEWAAPVSLGVVVGPVPSSVPSGEGPATAWMLGLLGLVGIGLVRRGQIVAERVRLNRE